MSRLNSKTHPLLTENILQLLRNKNIFTVVDYVENEPKQISATTGLTLKEVYAIRKHIANKNSAVTKNGFDYYMELRSNQAIIPTGIKTIDGLINGGFYTGNIYEICGKPACGKTQFCLHLMRNVAQNFHSNTCYIDTKRDFSAKRMRNLLKVDNQVQLGDILNRIMVTRINTRHDLINVLYKIKSDLTNGSLKTRLIIIDSLPPLLHTTTNHTENNRFLNEMVNVMRFLAVEYYLVVLVVNIVTVWYDSAFNEVQLATEKVGCGKYWKNVPNTRLKFEKVESKGDFSIKIAKEAKFRISENFVTVKVSDLN